MGSIGFDLVFLLNGDIFDFPSLFVTITHGHSHHSNYMLKCLLLAFWFHIDNIKPISHLKKGMLMSLPGPERFWGSTRESFFLVVGAFSRLQLRRKPDSGPESGLCRFCPVKTLQVVGGL